MAVGQVIPSESHSSQTDDLESVVRQYLPLAIELAGQCADSGEPDDDLVQVASLGLVIAARRYNEAWGIAFSSYAKLLITAELKRHVRDHAWVLQVPRRTKESALVVQRAISQELERRGREPTPRELTSRLNLDEREVLDALDACSARFPDSIDAPRSPDDGPYSAPLSSTLGSIDHGYELVEARLMRRETMRGFSGLERRILSLRYLEDQGQHDIAARTGTSRVRVSRVLRRMTRGLGLDQAVRTEHPGT